MSDIIVQSWLLELVWESAKPVHVLGRKGSKRVRVGGSKGQSGQGEVKQLERHEGTTTRGDRKWSTAITTQHTHTDLASLEISSLINQTVWVLLFTADTVFLHLALPESSLYWGHNSGNTGGVYNWKVLDMLRGTWSCFAGPCISTVTDDALNQRPGPSGLSPPVQVGGEGSKGRECQSHTGTWEKWQKHYDFH